MDKMHIPCPAAITDSLLMNNKQRYMYFKNNVSSIKITGFKTVNMLWDIRNGQIFNILRQVLKKYVQEKFSSLLSILPDLFIQS